MKTKANLYARAEIAEYWVVDVEARRLVVHREPGSGRYQSTAVFGPDEFVSPLAAPEHSLRVAEIFPDPL